MAKKTAPSSKGLTTKSNANMLPGKACKNVKGDGASLGTGKSKHAR
jgi:hypothetical protein